jgi:hypothetical protein
MANPFAKSRPANKPYAIYRAGDMSLACVQDLQDRPMNAATPTRAGCVGQEPATYGSFDMWRHLCGEVQRLRLACRRRARVAGSSTDTSKRGLPTPAEYLWQVADA